jgi:hypothetical protein
MPGQINRIKQPMRMGGVRMAKWGVALALAGLAMSPLAAQQATTNAVTPAPAPAPDVVGPGELRDFSLPGTVTRRTETPPASASPANGARQPETQPSDAAPLAVRSRPVPSTEPSRSVTVALPPPDPLAQRPTLAPPVDETSTVPSPPVIETVAPPPAAVPAVDDSGSWLPWLFALLLAAGIGAFFLWRQRNAGRLAHAGGERVEELVGTPLVPAPATLRTAQPVPARAPAPPPTPPRGDGIVSARLRPWLEIEFGATRAVVTDDATTIHFDVTLFNSGGAPARDVRVEAQMFNAGPAQDSELGAFFGRPAPSVAPIPEIAPLARIDMKSAVALPREQVKEYEVEGRKLFVPIMGFNAHYRFGTSPAQTSASFIVGRGGEDGGKMAPIRLDLGPRIFRGLSARQHSAGVRA